jgi:hypothetical protein
MKKMFRNVLGFLLILCLSGCVLAGTGLLEITNSCVHDLSAEGGCGLIELSWTDTGAASYNVYRGTVSGGPYVFLGSVTGTSYDDNGVVAGTTYYYVIRETAVTGDETCQSNEAVGTSGSCVPEFPGIVVPVLAIAVVLGLTAVVRK